MNDRLAFLVRVACLALLTLPSDARAQGATPADDRLRVFLDCPSGGCDRDFIVNELPYAIWTQDRLDADLHLLITSLTTGAGGRAYTLQFIAQRRLAPDVDTLLVAVPPNSSDDMQRRALTRSINLGLASSASRFVGAERFTIAYASPEVEADAVATNMRDRWNL